MNLIQIPKEYQDYVMLHVTQCRSKGFDFYTKMCESEFETFKEHIKRPKVVLDLGCGLGRMSIYMNWILNDSDTHYILCDSTNKDVVSISYGWKPQYSFYSNLEKAEQLCKLNGLVNFEVIDIKSLSKLKNIDLVMSFLSVGFHYPIEDYIDTLMDITTQDCEMIFGVRKGKYNENSFSSKFKTRMILKQNLLKEETKEDIMILQK